MSIIQHSTTTIKMSEYVNYSTLNNNKMSEYVNYSTLNNNKMLEYVNYSTLNNNNMSIIQHSKSLTVNSLFNDIKLSLRKQQTILLFYLNTTTNRGTKPPIISSYCPFTIRTIPPIYDIGSLTGIYKCVVKRVCDQIENSTK